MQTNITMTHFCKYFERAQSIFVTCPTPRSADNILTHASGSASVSNWQPSTNGCSCFDVRLINAAYEAPNGTIHEFKILILGLL